MWQGYLVSGDLVEFHLLVIKALRQMLFLE